MSTIRLIYILLHVLEIWMLFVAGRKMSQTKTDKEYWKASLWAFVPYVFVLGLRFGHNIDWNLYCVRYLEHKSMDWNTTEPIYHFLFYLFNSIGVPYFIVISFQVALFMFSFLLVAKHFKNCLYYVLPLLPVVAQSNDNYIRWYLAVSFALISLYFLLSDNKKKYIKCILAFIVGVLIHNGTLLLLAFIPVYYFGRKKHIPITISVITVFLSVFVVSISIMSFLSEIALSVYYLGGNSLQDVRLSTYLLKVSGMVTEGYGITGIGEYNLRNKVFTFVSFLPVIIYGPRYLNSYKGGILTYNLFIIGAFLNPFFSTIEIFDRYSKALLIFQAIVAGIVYYKLLKSKDTISAVRIFSLVSLLCCFYPFIRYSCMTTADYRMMYIWDSNGRDYINTDLYINDFINN